MDLRYNRMLRILAILLFTVELFAPSLFASERPVGATTESKKVLAESVQSIDLLAHFLFEENTSETKEGKDDVILSACCFEVFNQLQKFEIARVTWSLPRERFDTQPALYQLHRVLII